MDEARYFKFGILMLSVASTWNRQDKLFPKKPWSGSRDPFSLAG